VRVGILLFDGVDLLDAGGPYEVFLTASRLGARQGIDAPFEVVTLSGDGASVAAYGGLRLVPHASVADAGALDVVVVPGTIDLDGVLADPAILDAARSLCRGERLVASVCTGAFILADLGLLSGLSWTTHWEDIDALSGRIGANGAVRGVRWVDSGPVVTGGGLSSGIAMSLHLVDRLAGRELAEKTARQLDYQWSPSPEG
jgi:transcriptional regulator GlxA family with amidase domain